jgi:hypothetical protein
VLTDNETYELEILKLANENGKFAIEQMHLLLGPDWVRNAVNRLLTKKWIELVDITDRVAIVPGITMRVYIATPEAVKWMRDNYGHS